MLATGRGLRWVGPAFGGLTMGLTRRLVRAVTGRGPRRYREASYPDPLSDSREEMVELAPGPQALFDLWAGDALPLQVEKEAEARRAEKSAEAAVPVCKSFILFNISLV